MEAIRILLVEDVALNRYIVVQYLQSWQDDIQVDEASSGAEAVEKVKSNTYDLILMDIRMPEMDGYEAAKAIRALHRPGLQNVPIIALTGDTVTDRQDENIQVFTDVVAKPFNPHELYAKVLKYTSTAKSDVLMQEKAHAKKTPEAVFRYQHAEDSFRSNTSRILNFYNMAEKTLISYKENYRKAVNQLDVVALDNINHKAKVTLKMLGLEETFQVRLEEGGALLERKAPDKERREFLKDIMRQFDEVTEALRNRHDHIRQHGLEG